MSDLVIGIDPGASGAIAVLYGGEFDDAYDMPTLPRKAGGEMVNAPALALLMRGIMLTAQPGDRITVVIEQVSAMRGQGVSSMFRFGQADGMVRGVVGALGLSLVEVTPVVWKRQFGLLGQPKDQARTAATQFYPEAAPLLARKKDCGRADALLIARYAYRTEALLLARSA
jgi:crossover junction endodeoxyribonuclease RuvC